jgi:hypothetical protein
MNKKILILSLVISLVLFVSISFFIGFQVATTYQAHATFEGYCHWRGLQVLNKSDNYGFCISPEGQTYKMVEVANRWYLDGDLPNGWPF